MYDNPHMDSYLSDEQDPDLGGGLGSIHAFGGMGLGDDMENDEKASLALASGGRWELCQPLTLPMDQQDAACTARDMLQNCFH